MKGLVRILVVGLLILGFLWVSDGVYGKNKKTVKEKFANKVLIVQFEVFTKEADKDEFKSSSFVAIIKNLSEIKGRQSYKAKFEFNGHHYGVDVHPSRSNIKDKEEKVLELTLLAGQFDFDNYGAAFNSSLFLDLKPDMGNVSYAVSYPTIYRIHILLVNSDDSNIELFTKKADKLIPVEITIEDPVETIIIK